MDGQMTIFDFLPPPEDDLETLDEEVMVARIAERTGLIFKKQPSDRWLEHPTYKAKYKKATIEVQYSRYDTLDDNNGKRFIGVGYSFSKGGGGSPCDSLTKAVDRIKGYQQTIDDMDKPKVYECEIRGLCDDAYCPECGYGFLDNETDRPECPNCGTRVSWGKYHRINDHQCATCEYRVWLHPKDGNTRQGCTYHGGHGCHYEERKCCNNCNRYRMTVDATTCEPRYMICHRPGTSYGDQIPNPESHVCECWKERGTEL